MIRGLLCCPLALLGTACSSGTPQDSAQAPEPAARQDAAALATAAPAMAFRYTGLADCPVIRADPEEAGFYEYECPGEGGYRLRKVQADLRDNLVVLAPDGSEHALGLPALADGAFGSLGNTAEWRGTETGGSFAPRSLIVRHSAMEDPDPEVADKSYLVVVALAPRPCVVARIAPEPGQNDRARRIADRGAPCLAAPG